MKFSAQEEYGLRCLIAIAKMGPGASLTIPEVSEMEGMTTSHAAKILAILRRSGFVKSTRGQLGGYTLARNPSQIVLRDVLEPLGGRMFGQAFCDRHTGVRDECVHQTDCLLRPLWSSIQQAVDDIVGRYSLEDLMQGKIEVPPVHLTLARTANQNPPHEIQRPDHNSPATLLNGTGGAYVSQDAAQNAHDLA